MIYNGSLRDTTNRRSEKYIEINSCNFQHSHGKSHTVIRREGRVDYHVLFISEGECECLYNGREYLMKSGDFVVYLPNEEQKYSFMEGIAVTTMWIHFSGVGVEEIFAELGLRGGVFSANFPAEVRHHFKKLIKLSALNMPKYRVLARGYLLNLLSSLSSGGEASTASVYSGAVADMLEYISLNWQSNISVAELAEKVNLSESRAAHLFRETVGKPVHKYITELKIENSKDLLLNTNMSISEISAMVGVEDPLYFSRTFKSAVGVSPREYRK